MLAKTTTHRQRYWLKHDKAADLSDSTIAEYATANDISLKGLYQWKTKLINRGSYYSFRLNGGRPHSPISFYLDDRYLIKKSLA